MRKIFIALFIILSLSAFAQRSRHEVRHFQNRYQHELHHEIDHRENRRNFLKTDEYRRFRLSERSRDHFDRIYEYIGHHPEFGFHLNFDFTTFDCAYYDPCYRFMVYPDYYSVYGRGYYFPHRHIVWFEEPNLVNIDIEAIDPDDIIVVGDRQQDWLYLRDYVRICARIRL